MFRKLTLATLLAIPLIAGAENVPIIGNVSSKCIIHIDKPGVYGNPAPNMLSTAVADGGVQPIIRYDVVNAGAGYYKAVITTPNSFSSSPSISDNVTWNGSVSVSEVTDAAMSAYTTNKRTYQNTSEFDLTIAGTVWFKASSSAEYG